MLRELFSSDIMVHAFTGGAIVAVVAGAVGYFVVLRAQAFAAEAFTDIGFAGATGAALLGVASFAGMIVFSLLAAAGLGIIGNRARGRDVEIGMVLSFALGLGVLFLSIYSRTSASHAMSGINILFGSILTISSNDILLALGSCATALAALALLHRPLLFASVDPAGAEARGVPVRAISAAFLAIVALTTAGCVLLVGVLLAASLLIAPAAAAVNLTNRPGQAIALSMATAVGVTWCGLVLTFTGTIRHLPAGFYISALAALVYGASLVLRKRLRRVRVFEYPHGDRETG
ncbi:MAG: metal ABC transporter permease [Syntrophobacteraceae bacterium]|nr:metal ABC transporter permease [Syntrophobacteraceae bacterium]